MPSLAPGESQGSWEAGGVPCNLVGMLASIAGIRAREKIGRALMECDRVERLIVEFLGQHPGKVFCHACVIAFAPIQAPEDQVTTRHLLCTTPAWEKQRQLGRCSRCLGIADVWGL